MTCPICLDSIEQNFIANNELICNHKFHKLCIQKWLKINKICPICRVSSIEKYTELGRYCDKKYLERDKKKYNKKSPYCNFNGTYYTLYLLNN